MASMAPTKRPAPCLNPPTIRSSLPRTLASKPLARRCRRRRWRPSIRPTSRSSTDLPTTPSQGAYGRPLSFSGQADDLGSGDRARIADAVEVGDFMPARRVPKLARGHAHKVFAVVHDRGRCAATRLRPAGVRRGALGLGALLGRLAGGAVLLGAPLLGGRHLDKH